MAPAAAQHWRQLISGNTDCPESPYAYLLERERIFEVPQSSSNTNLPNQQATQETTQPTPIQNPNPNTPVVRGKVETRPLKQMRLFPDNPLLNPTPKTNTHLILKTAGSGKVVTRPLQQKTIINPNPRTPSPNQNPNPNIPVVRGKVATRPLKQMRLFPDNPKLNAGRGKVATRPLQQKRILNVSITEPDGVLENRPPEPITTTRENPNPNPNKSNPKRVILDATTEPEDVLKNRPSEPITTTTIRPLPNNPNPNTYKPNPTNPSPVKAKIEFFESRNLKIRQEKQAAEVSRTRAGKPQTNEINPTTTNQSTIIDPKRIEQPKDPVGAKPAKQSKNTKKRKADIQLEQNKKKWEKFHKPKPKPE
jgi:hypothetical protein